MKDLSTGQRYDFTSLSKLFKFVALLDNEGIHYSTQILADVVTVEIL